MPDFFALLNQPRRPWLDPAALKQAFLEAAARCHPDRVHDAPVADREQAHQTYTSLNQAHQCLREPHSRLRHLIELETGHRPQDLQEMPPELVDLFSAIHRCTRETDQFLADRAKAASPMLQVALLARSAQLSEELSRTKERIEAWSRDLEARLQEADARWVRNLGSAAANIPYALLRELEILSREFSFHKRWADQIQSRLMKLLP